MVRSTYFIPYIVCHTFSYRHSASSQQDVCSYITVSIDRVVPYALLDKSFAFHMEEKVRIC